jgi:hypothetical protein
MAARQATSIRVKGKAREAQTVGENRGKVVKRMRGARALAGQLGAPKRLIPEFSRREIETRFKRSTEMRKIVESPAQRDIGNSMAETCRIAQVATAMLEAPRPHISQQRTR